MKRVLIIDDAAFIRRILRSMLEKNQYRVVGEAENGLIGLEKYNARKPDVVLLDIVMPVMDGLECLKQLKRLNPNVNVIICSTVDDPKVVQEIYQLGVIDFITKPIKEERLMRTLKKLFSGEPISFAREDDDDDDDDDRSYSSRGKSSRYGRYDHDDEDDDDYDIDFLDEPF